MTFQSRARLLSAVLPRPCPSMTVAQASTAFVLLMDALCVRRPNYAVVPEQPCFFNLQVRAARGSACGMPRHVPYQHATWAAAPVELTCLNSIYAERAFARAHQAAVVGGAETMFDWLPERRTRLHLVPLAGGPVRNFDAPTYFTFHYINAFETADGRSLCFGAPDAHAFLIAFLTHGGGVPCAQKAYM